MLDAVHCTADTASLSGACKRQRVCQILQKKFDATAEAYTCHSPIEDTQGCRMACKLCMTKHRGSMQLSVRNKMFCKSRSGVSTLNVIAYLLLHGA